MTHPKYPGCTHCTPNRLCHEHTRAEDAKVRAAMEQASKPAGLVWEDPPSSAAARRETEYGAAFDALMKHPKRWARIREFSGLTSASTAVQSLKKGEPLRPGKWEFRAVRNGAKGSRLYARYLGEGE